MKTKLARPVLVESKEESHLQIRDGKLYCSDKLFCANNPDMPEIGFINPNHNQQLILISLEDEKIEVGENYYNTRLNKVFEAIANDGYPSKEDCKVIATQSQLSSEYIQKFIEEYNKGEVKDIRIEMVYMVGDSELTFGNSHITPSLKPKLTNGFVTIVEKEPKQYSHNLLCNMQYYMEYCKSNGYITPQDWLNNFKHYSDSKEPINYNEKEVKRLTYEAMFNGNTDWRYPDKYFEDWFEHNKKK